MQSLDLIVKVCNVISTYGDFKKGIKIILEALSNFLPVKSICLLLNGKMYYWPEDIDSSHCYNIIEHKKAWVQKLPRIKGEKEAILIFEPKEPFTEKEKKIIQIVCDQIANFNRNIKTKSELKKGSKMLLNLHMANKDISATLDKKELAHKLAYYAKEFSHAKRAKVVLFGDLEAVSGKKGKNYDESLYKRWAIPLITSKATWGILELYIPKQKGMSRYERRVIHLLAELAAVSLENSALYEDLKKLSEEREKRIRLLSLLYQVGNAYRETSELKKRVFLALRALTDPTKGFGFHEAYLYLKDEVSEEFKGIAGVCWSEGHPWGEREWRIDEEYIEEIQNSGSFVDISSAVLKNFLPINISAPPKDTPYLKDEHFYLLFPLVAGESVIGALIVGNDSEFTSEDIQALEMFCDQLALALESAKLQQSLRESSKELKKAQERFLRSEKLAALGELAAKLAHDLKNPLVAIGGFAKRLHNKMAEDSPDKIYTATILKEVDEAEKIVSNILGYSKIPKLKKRLQDINRLVDDVIFIYAEEMRDRGIAFDKNLDRDLPAIEIDPPQMKQVFMNLITNAMQAIGKNGTIAISTSLVEREGVPYLKIVFSDTGKGIPEDILPNIFNPFFTTKSTGTGLGLYIAKRIVELHGGDMEVINRAPSGAEFIVYLPLTSKENKTHAAQGD